MDGMASPVQDARSVSKKSDLSLLFYQIGEIKGGKIDFEASSKDRSNRLVYGT
jgi:hypothetical protein